MKYRNLGRTGLKVSELCMGTMQFGWTSTEEQAFTVLDAYVESGGTFIDTADVYSRWVPNNPGGVSEQIIGRWMKARGNRDAIVIATKVRGAMGPGPNDVGLSRKHIMDAVHASLRRLDIEYIDLYQAHSDDLDTPLDETLQAFDDLVRQGLVRYIGASNYDAWRMMQSLWVSDSRNLVRYDSLQPHYSLAHRREFEAELEPLCLQQGIGVIPYSPLAGGFLTGKYRRGQALPESDRAGEIRDTYLHDNGFDLIDRLDEIAARHDATPAQISLAWLLARPSISAPIIGANSPDQWNELVKAVDVTLTQEDTETLNAASEWA